MDCLVTLITLRTGGRHLGAKLAHQWVRLNPFVESAAMSLDLIPDAIVGPQSSVLGPWLNRDRIIPAA